MFDSTIEVTEDEKDNKKKIITHLNLPPHTIIFILLKF